MLNQEAVPNNPSQETAHKPGERQRTVVNCNFRSAGRLSNENARSLTGIHETFARHLASTLDAYLGTGLDVKLRGVDQLPVKDHVAGIGPMSYIVPFSLQTIPSTMIVECDIDLVFPMIELLMGGRGSPADHTRELSEIEEEIMHDLTALIARQAENAWRMPAQALKPGRRIKSSLLHQYCPANEKVTVVQFEIELAGTSGTFQLVFPTTFLNVLIQQVKAEEPQKRGSVRFFPRPGIRERMLDCDVEVAAELPGLRVAVRDLIALEPGSVLKLRAPVRAPGMLTAGGHAIFEATPVRNGLQKAAQLGRRTVTNHWERG
ncbi:MAG TPA: FliM/FliN family flagellar motor switch protein [Acidobacteriaceae bacterium]|jgi:flagellar motor switch protein FliM|nr:FliM/FliN family flagellar motor switch protein [Acidobacteriaceae bacterium]